jgi:signal transduction histidine kinase
MVYLVPIGLSFSLYEPFTLLLLVLFLCITFFAKYKTYKMKKLLLEFYSYRDNAKELEILLEEKNQKLLENQDVEIHLATLNERNRISKEIHDNIGHLISRSLIHIGALLTVSKEKNTKEGLHVLQDSLSEGMDSIRSSIHNIHNESIDLFSQIDTLVKDFCFCPISFDYSLRTSPTLPLKYFFIWTIKEALANIMKHSNGSNVTVVLMEHPIMYQLIIYDNGRLTKEQTKKVEEMNENTSNSKGMGVRNMIERVQGFGGMIQFSGDNGFKIFITIPINKT